MTRCTFLALAFKLAEEAAKTWRRIRAPEKVAALLAGARYKGKPPDHTLAPTVIHQI